MAIVQHCAQRLVAVVQIPKLFGTWGNDPPARVLTGVQLVT